MSLRDIPKNEMLPEEKEEISSDRGKKKKPLLQAASVKLIN
jgi:hypothetical protein